MPTDKGYRTKDITGERFGRLAVVRLAEKRGRVVQWLCVCDCGKERVVSIYNLLSGNTKSCGCFQRDVAREIFWVKKTHGMERHYLYPTWRNMLARCYDTRCKAYPDYGGRGIAVCARWHDIALFVKDVHPRPEDTSLDRIDNDGDYTVSNCRWATRTMQARNKRNNRVLTYKGVTKLFIEWIDELDMSPSTLWRRLDKGWPVEKAFETPVNKNLRRVQKCT